MDTLNWGRKVKVHTIPTTVYISESKQKVMKKIGVYAKDKYNNLHNFEHGAGDEFYTMNTDGDMVMSNPEDYDIIYVFTSDDPSDEVLHIMVGSEDALKSFREDTFEDFKKEFEDEFEVGAYKKNLLDVSLLKSIENWGSYQIVTIEEYNKLST